MQIKKRRLITIGLTVLGFVGGAIALMANLGGAREFACSFEQIEGPGEKNGFCVRREAFVVPIIVAFQAPASAPHGMSQGDYQNLLDVARQFARNLQRSETAAEFIAYQTAQTFSTQDYHTLVATLRDQLTLYAQQQDAIIQLREAVDVQSLRTLLDQAAQANDAGQIEIASQILAAAYRQIRPSQHVEAAQIRAAEARSSALRYEREEAATLYAEASANLTERDDVQLRWSISQERAQQLYLRASTAGSLSDIQSVASVLAREVMPLSLQTGRRQDYATTQLWLGLANWSVSGRTSQASEVSAARASARESLEHAAAAWPRNDLDNWAKAQTTFASFLATTGVADDRNRAIGLLRQVLSAVSPQTSASCWACAQLTLASAQSENVRSGDTSSAAPAAAAFDAASRAFLRLHDRATWITTQQRWAEMEFTLARRTRDLNTALSAVQRLSALEQDRITNNTNRESRGAFHESIGRAYGVVYELGNPASLEPAIRHLEAAASTFTPEDNCGCWATSHYWLGVTYYQAVRSGLSSYRAAAVQSLTYARDGFAIRGEQGFAQAAQRILNELTV